MAKGESLEALLSPQLRVSRPVAACSRCRNAKIKCDGKLPACTACERAGKADSCSGANDDFAKGRERSYVAALEAALERLQRRVAEAKTLQITDPGRRDAVAASYMLGPGHALPARRLVSGSRVQRKEASDVDNLVGDFGFLSVNATSRDFHGFTATMSFARLLLAVSKSGDLPQLLDTRSLPARHTLAPIIQQYLDELFVLLPFFSETDLMASVSAVYADAGRLAKATDQWMVRMVLAIVAANSSKEKGDPNWHLAQENVAAALGYAEDVLHPGSIAGIQAILLLAQYSMLDPDLFSCWHLIGFASRVMVDLGLHNEPVAEVRMSKEESEMRRRVFYCVYSLDRNIAMALERSFSFTDDSTFVNLPTVHHSTIPPDSARNRVPQLFLRSLQPSLYLFDIRRVQSALYQETRLSNRSEWPDSTATTYKNSILKDVRSWVSKIPTVLPESHTVLFSLESLYSQIAALAPSCRNQNISELSRTLIFEYAIQYADQLHPITRNSNWHAFFTVTEIYRLNYIGRQFLSGMWASFDHLLSGAMPREKPLSSPEADGTAVESPSPPSPDIFRPTSSLENSTRAIRCLTKIIDVLKYAHKRFGNSCASCKTNFEQESAVLMNKLRTKQQELGTVQYITGGPPRVQQQQQQQLPPLPYIAWSQGVPIPPGLPLQQTNPPRTAPAPYPPVDRLETRPHDYQPAYGLPPIGLQPQPRIPAPLGGRTPEEQTQFRPVNLSDIEPAQRLEQGTQPPLAVPGPQNRDLTYQQDVPHGPRMEEVPPSWLLAQEAPEHWGPMGPYQGVTPPQTRGEFLDMPPSSSMPRRTYEFNGTGEDGGAGAGGGRGAG
jgi:Fungal specific transcription factor domain/Fungal Zn(2)-Cys(6) binuclear cluster domain